MSDRVAPHSLEAERAALGAILIDPARWSDLAGVVCADDFFRHGHALVFRSLAEMAAAGACIDLLTLTTWCKDRDRLDDVGGPAYLAGLTDGVPKSSNVQYYGRIVQGHARRRRLMSLLTQAAGDVHGGDMAAVVASLRGRLEDESAALDDGELLLEPAHVVAAREHGSPARFLIDGLLPAVGHSLFCGLERTTKSITQRALVASLLTGRTALGLSRLRVSDVVPIVYITEEDGAAAILEHLDAFTDGAVSRGETPLYLSACRGLSLDDPRTQDRIIREIQTCGAALVVIEPLRSVTACVDGTPKEFAPFGQYLRRLVRETGAATLLGHHEVKRQAGADSRKGTDRVSGGAIVSYCESPTMFRRLNDANVLVTPTSWKHSAAPPPFSVRLETLNGRVSRVVAEDIDPESTADSARAEQDRRLIAAVAASPGASTAEVVRKAKVKNQAGRDALSRLAENGVLRAVPRGTARTWYPAEAKPALSEVAHAH